MKTSSRSWLKTVARLSGKIVFFIFFTVLLTEAGFRIYNRINPTFVFPSADYNRFRCKPGTRIYGFELNSGGFHDREYSKEKGRDVFRILGIGDSNVFGVVPYPQNFLTLLEDRLNGDGTPAEVINMGIPRTTVNHYYSLLVNEGLSWNADMAIIFLYLGNDLLELERQEKRKERLYVCSFFRYLFGVLPEFEGEHPGYQRYNDGRPSLGPDKYLEIQRLRSRFFLAGNPELPGMTKRIAGILEMTRDVCRHEDIELLVVIIPDEMQVSRRLRESLFTACPDLSEQRLDLHRPNRLLLGELESLGIPHLDLTPDFEEAAAVENLYKPRDTHWNIAGNRLAADILHHRLSAEIGRAGPDEPAER